MSITSATDFNKLCTAVTRSEFVTKCIYLLTYYFDSVLLMTSLLFADDVCEVN